jgi:hypothetical protein
MPMRGELGQYVVITASAHANLLIEDTTLGAAVVEQIRDESTILQVWVNLYKWAYDGKEPIPLEINRFQRYVDNCILISQVSCGVCGIFEQVDAPREEALQEPKVLSSREVEQATIQTFMSSLVKSGVPLTNNVMQLILYFIRHVLRATFNSNYGNIMGTIANATDPDKPWYEQIQQIADSDSSWSSYTDIDITKNLCKHFTCEPSEGESELYYANYGMHVNLLGDAILDMSIRNIMMNPDPYIKYITIRNEHDMRNPNIKIAIRAIQSLHETHKTNIAALFAIADAFKLRLALFDSGCEYYQDQGHVKVLRCGKVVATAEQKIESEKMPTHVKEMQPPADSQFEERWVPELGGGNRFTKYRRRNKMIRRTTKKKHRRRAKRKTNRPKRKYKYRYTKRKHNNKRMTR